MGKTTNTTAQENKGQNTNRPEKSVSEKRRSLNGTADKAKKGIKRGAGAVGRGIREGMIDVASLGLSVLVGDAVSTAANNTFIKGAAAANSGFNALTGRGTVNVKTKFGGWKAMSLPDYTAAVNRGVKFKDTQADFFVNRHASEFNTAGKIIGGVAGGTAGVGTFIGSREALTKATRTRKERATDEKLNRQNMAAILEESMDSYYGYESTSSNCDDDFFEDEEE